MKNQQGLTLIGVVISAAILSTAMVALLGYQANLQVAKYQQQNVYLGNMLATEGIELARAVRDKNLTTANRIAGVVRWDEGLGNAGTGTVGYYSVSHATNINDGFDNTTACRDRGAERWDSTCQLRFDTNQKLYGAAGQTTQIYRLIEISGIENVSPTSGGIPTRRIRSVVRIVGRGGREQLFQASTVLYGNTN